MAFFLTGDFGLSMYRLISLLVAAICSWVLVLSWLGPNKCASYSTALGSRLCIMSPWTFGSNVNVLCRCKRTASCFSLQGWLVVISFYGFVFSSLVCPCSIRLSLLWLNTCLLAVWGGLWVFWYYDT
ncbi:hypothetical protein GOP47_0004617 [Adiantum capillus-veneris]|uniref:Uncharacterized protein n=1 Tax=Adiantum capillus-veneris TaxID=13818 RepID=A0A9D4V7W4_ADICA|nr:hypothetical protein GOP47_0004617 [Adiantum capillus-veneris]